MVFGSLPKCSSLTILGGQVVSVNQGIRLCVEGAYVMHHNQDEDNIFDAVMEGCSGIGCLGVGLSSLGFNVRTSVDHSKFMCGFMTKQGRSGVIHGNLGDRSTMYEMWKQCPSSSMLSGGFSCQPWSALGDGRKADDSRASSLVFLLRCGFFLRCHTILLECVSNAGKDTEVQKVLKLFSSQTGFVISDCHLALSDIMPAKRDRWWCAVTNPMVPKVQLRPLPKVEPAPCFMDLFPVLCDWPPSELLQLQLDKYESSKFEECGGLCRNLVVATQPMKTALHGWSNQLTGCPCGCRNHAMSNARLKSKGLFSALFLTGGDFEWATWSVPCTRHVHPIELAAVHGMVVDWQWGPSMRGSLAALGQLASPVQSCWLGAQLKVHFDDLRGLPTSSPEQGLMRHFEIFFRSLQDVIPKVFQLPGVQTFCQRVQSTLYRSHQAHLGPALPISDPVATESGEDLSNSQRRGRNDLWKHQDETKQPATGMQEPEKRKNQPATETQELENQKQPAVETQELQEEAGGPKWTQSPVRAMPSSRTDELGPSQPLPSFANESSLQHLANPVHGGIPAFATAMPSSVTCSGGIAETDSAAYVAPLVVPSGFTTLPADAEVAPTQVDLGDAATSPGSFTLDLANTFHALEQQESRIPAEVVGEPSHHDTEMECDPVEADLSPAPAVEQEVGSAADFETEYHVVQLIHRDDLLSKPIYLRVSKQTTVGEISVADCKLLGQTVTSTRMCDAVGCSLRLGDTTEPFQQLFVQSLDQGAPMPGTDALPPALQTAGHSARIQLLLHQEAWVAVDEMQHYLALIAANGQVASHPVAVVPKLYMVEDMCQQLHAWAASCIEKLSFCTRVASMLLVDNHWFPVLFAASPFGFVILTTPEGRLWMEVALQNIPNVRYITTIFISSEFPNDCGFQAVAWMTSVAFKSSRPP